MVQADLLVLLSDIDGLYTADPRKDPAAAHIPLVAAMTPEIDAMGGEPPPGYSSGGMKTKLVAAHIATQSGVAMAIALGHRQNPLAAIESGAKCTWFLPAPEGRSARKNWIAGHLAPLGTITIDDGAARALAKGSSLLPAGIKSVSGTFERGDAVDVLTLKGARIARGLAAYSSSDAAIIAGHRSEDFESLLGFRGRDEAIHRDDLVLF